MKVIEAIGRLKNLAVHINAQGLLDDYLAILLALVALERHRDRDYMSFATFIDKLPGED